MKKGILFLSALTIFFISTIKSYSQDRWTKINYSASTTGANGLISQYVICIYEDHLGNVWFGTADGISIWNGSTWKSYTTLDGLIVNEVADIVEDNDYNIWIGYGSYVCGVSRFNGTSFENFNISNGLVNDKVNSIFKDSKGNIWFATIGGISEYKDSTWTNYTTEQGLPSNRISTIKEDQNGDFLIGTDDKGLWRFNGSQFTPFSWVENSKSFINDVFADSKGNVWVGGYGLHKYNGSWTSVNPFHTREDGYVFDIEEDSKGKIYFATSDGLAVLNGSEWTYYTTTEGTPSNEVYKLMIQDDDKLLIGTNVGVGVFDGINWTKIQTSNGGLISNEVNFVFKDKYENIWICTQAGISKYKNFEWESFNQTPNGEVIEWVTSGLQDKSGNLWFTSVHGIYMYNSTGWHLYYKDESYFFNVVQDKSGTLWFTSYSGVYKFDGKIWAIITEANGLPSKSTNGLFIDQHDNVWIGSNKGISMWDGKTFTHYPLADYITGGMVYSFVENNHDVLLASTFNGLISFTDNSWVKLEGSPLGWTFSSFQDRNKVLWFGTVNGLYKYDDENWTRYSTEDGLVSNVIQSIFREKNNGVFWFSTPNGISTLHPDVLAQVSSSSKQIDSKDENYSIHLECEGITQPFQFSLDGVNYAKNGGVFENLSEGYYTAYVTNAYDTIKIENIKLGNPTMNTDPQEILTNIKLYPNPTNGKFYISGYTGRVEVFNIQGKKIIDKRINSDNGYVDLSDFAAGFYIVKCNNKRGYLIKQ